MSKIRKNLEYYRLPSEIDIDMEGDNEATNYANTNFGDLAAANRIVKNIADGASTNDAVNYGQLQAVAGTIPDQSIYTLIDGTRPFTGNQSLGYHKLTAVADGDVDQYDAVNYGQLQAVAALIPTIPDHSIYTVIDGTRAFTGDQSMGSHKLTSLTDGVNLNDAVNYGQLQTVVGLIPVIPDHSIYTLSDGTRPFTGNQSMGSRKLYDMTDGTVDGDSVHYGQFEGNANIQKMPNGLFFAWGTETISNDGTSGVKVTIDPKNIVNIANATTGDILSIQSVQVTNEGVTTVAGDYDADVDFLNMKVDFVDGDATFDVACFRSGASTSETNCIVRWFIVGQLV